MSYEDRTKLRRGVAAALAGPLADVVEELHYDYRMNDSPTDVPAIINEVLRHIHIGVEGELRRRSGE